MRTCERTYADLMFRATGKYASWDPEIPIKVGDYGRITRGRRGLAFWRRNGAFVREGNIYTDGMADRFGIPAPIEYGADSEGETWVTSSNVTTVDLSFSAGGIHPPFAQLKAEAEFKCTSGRGAILVMRNATTTAIENPGALERLLADGSMRNMVVVSEVHSCSFYARGLVTDRGGSISLVLGIDLPVPGRIAAAAADARWGIGHGRTQNFKSQINKKGERTFYPLLRLVSLSERKLSAGIGS